MKEIFSALLPLEAEDTPEAMSRAFERFYREHDEMTATVGGLGLGLSISRELARMLGGDMTVRARPGGGCVFEASFPNIGIQACPVSQCLGAAWEVCSKSCHYCHCVANRVMIQCDSLTTTLAS